MMRKLIHKFCKLIHKLKLVPDLFPDYVKIEVYVIIVVILFSVLGSIISFCLGEFGGAIVLLMPTYLGLLGLLFIYKLTKRL